MPSIVSFLKKNAECSPERPAVSDALQTLSYRELWQKAQGVASWLAAQGISKETNVLVEACAEASFAVIAMGIELAGCVLVPVEKNAPRSLRLRLAEEMQSSLLIGKETLDAIRCVTFSKLLSENGECNHAAWAFPQDGDAAEILYTTGTTGQSKAVVLTHRAVFASADNNLCADRLTDGSVYLIASPLNHISALRKLCACILAGAHAVLLDGFFDLKDFYGTIERYQVNSLVLSPTAIRFLLLVSRDKLRTLSEKIRLVHTNGAPMTETDQESMRRILPHARLIFGYGATEAGSVCAFCSYAEFPGRANCVGKASPHTQITVVDDERREIRSSKDHPGYLVVTGDTVMKAYWHDPERTAEVLQGNILYTNDLGYFDESGLLYVIGRRGEIINCGGLKVAPVEVENAVMHYPGIRECVCFGVPDPMTGSAVKVQFVPEDEKSFDLKAFRRFLQDRLESHQLPRFIECVREIPKTPNGKIDRKRLIWEPHLLS